MIVKLAARRTNSFQDRKSPGLRPLSTYNFAGAAPADAAAAIRDLAGRRSRLVLLNGRRTCRHGIQVNDQWRTCFEPPGGSYG